MKRLASWLWEFVILGIAWLVLCAAFARGQTSGPSQCGPGGCGVGIDLGLGIGAWRKPRPPASQPAQQPSREPVPAQAVRIANTVSGATYYATGAFVAHGDQVVVLTCRHAFKAGAGQIAVMTADGRQFRATLISVDRAEDLAALAVATRPAQSLIVATEYPRGGEPVRGGGFGEKGQWRWITGACRGFVYADRSKSKAVCFAFAGGAREGDSGGPVLNQRGELVGILWGTDDRETFATYCGAIAKFLACLPRQSPVASTPQPAAAGQGFPPPGSVAPGPASRSCDCSPVVAQIEALGKAWEGHRQAADKRMEAVAAAVTKHGIAVNEQAAGAAELQQTIKALPKTIDEMAVALKALPSGMAAVKAAVESQKAAATAQASVVTEVHQIVAGIPAAIGTAAADSGRTALWTALLGALGVGTPAGIGLAIGLRLLGRAVNRRAAATQKEQPAVSAPPPVASPQSPAEPIVDRQIITAPVPTAHERALQAAVDLYSERYPGGGSLIQSYVSQFESGNLGALK